MRAALLAVALTAAAAQAACASLAQQGRAAERQGEEARVGQTLDALHAAAARADGPAYFALYTPDAVFIGTDVTERWTLPQFRAYAQPFFSQGKGWIYKVRTRRVAFAPDGDTAWFDEVLDSQSYGTSRGTGVLLRTPAGWRVAQYALTFPIPNDLAKDLTARIRAHEAQASPR